MDWKKDLNNKLFQLVGKYKNVNDNHNNVTLGKHNFNKFTKSETKYAKFIENIEMDNHLIGFINWIFYKNDNVNIDEEIYQFLNECLDKCFDDNFKIGNMKKKFYYLIKNNKWKNNKWKNKNKRKRKRDLEDDNDILLFIFFIFNRELESVRFKSNSDFTLL